MNWRDYFTGRTSHDFETYEPFSKRVFLNIVSISGFILAYNIAYFIDKEWNKREQEFIIEYLKKGVTFTLVSGILNEDDFCRFRCEKYFSKARYFTDGKYVWPEDFIHHVSCHAVVPPKEFIIHAMGNIDYGNSIIPFIDGTCIEDTKYQIRFLSSWWFMQKGFLQKTYLDSITNVYFLSVTRKIEQTKILLKNRGLPFNVKIESNYRITGEIQVPYTYKDNIKEFINDMEREKIKFTFFELR